VTLIRRLNLLTVRMLITCAAILVTHGAFAGGAGADGGGGSTVLTKSGAVRFLDLAEAENIPVQDFGTQFVENLYLKQGRWVKPVAQVVASAHFFKCALKKISGQRNPLLRAVNFVDFDLVTVFTPLPLIANQRQKMIVVFPDAANWPNQARALSPEILRSPNYSSKQQWPVASYAPQSINKNFGGKLKSETLMVSQPLFEVLSEEDRCALEVHEFLRFLGTFGQDMEIRWLDKPLSTAKIEKLTAMIMRNQQVATSEFPATVYFEAIAIYGKEKLESMSYMRLQEVEQGLLNGELEKQYGLPKARSGKMTLAETVSIMVESKRTSQSTFIAEDAISHVANENPFSAAFTWRLNQNHSLDPQDVDIVQFFEVQ